MNWGWKLIVASALFMALIVYFVVKSFTHSVDLVSDNYYEEELNYQEQIDAKKNADTLIAGLNINLSADAIVIEYPSFFCNTVSEGTIYFYKPSNAQHDKKIKFTQQDCKQFIPRTMLEKGRYQVKIDLNADGKAYYFEKQLIIE